MKIRFYHIPKSGGTAIYQMTKHWPNFKRAHPHKNHVHVYKYPPHPNEIGMIVIRHPYSRFVSAFYHMVDACHDQFFYRHAEKSDCEDLKRMGIDMSVFQNDPNHFLFALKHKQHPYHQWAYQVFHNFSIFKSQFYWAGDIFGFTLHPGIKMILRQENLRHDFDVLAEKLGHRAMWPVGNESNQRITQDVMPLNEQSKQDLNQLYSDDFKHFKF